MSRQTKETSAIQVFPFLAVLVCTMGSLIFLLLLTTRQVRQRAIALAEFQLAQMELAAAESAPPPAVIEPDPKPEAAPVILIPPQPPTEKKAKPLKLPRQDYSLAIATRERELSDLKTKWKLRVDQLSKERDGHRSDLNRQKQKITTTNDDTETLQSEVDRLEVQLGQVSGEAAALSTAADDDTERLALEQQIAALKKQLRAAEDAELSEGEKFQVIPFDPLTGTTRRPIFIECTEQGLRFLPEDVTVTAADLSGFTNRVNPLAAGTGALINYWTARNLRQRNTGAQSEPYVLLLVRPNGICAYYIAMKMLEAIRTQHGYELIDDSISLQLPEVDPGAKAACQAAVDRLLAERENVFRSAMNTGGGGSVFGVSSRGTVPSSGRGSGTAGGTYSERMANNRRGEGNTFTITDVTGDDPNQRESDSMDPIDNFSGRSPRRPSGNVSRGSDGSRGGDGPTSDLPPRIVQGTDRAGSLRGTPTFGPTVSSGNAGQAGRSGRQDGDGSDIGGYGDASAFTPGKVNEMPVGRRPGKKGIAQADVMGAPADGQDVDIPGGVPGAADGGTGGAGTRPQPGGSPPPNMLSDDGASWSRRNLGARRSPMSSDPSQKSKPSKEPENRQLEPEMLAGRRWGISDQGASIGFEREVRVDVDNEKCVIAEKYDVPIKPDGSKQELFEQFATSLDRHSHEWGRPPQGFFWTPRLKFIVKPEATAHYEQLNSLMTRAGISTTHEFAKTAAKVEFGRDAPAPIKMPPKGANSGTRGGRQ